MRAQDVILRSRQTAGQLVRDRHASIRQIHYNGAKADLPCRSRHALCQLLPTQGGTNLREEDVRVRLLFNKVIRPQRVGTKFLHVVSTPRQDEDGDLRIVFADEPTCLKPIHPRHHDIQDNDVRPPLQKRGDPFDAILRKAHLIAFGSEDATIRRSRHTIVVDEQDLLIFLHSFSELPFCSRRRTV